MSAFSGEADMPSRAGLAVDAVTSNDYLGWFFLKREVNCTAAASSIAHRKSPHRLLSLQSLVPTNAGEIASPFRRKGASVEAAGRPYTAPRAQGLWDTGQAAPRKAREKPGEHAGRSEV
jgi:hypothetical protein